MEVTLNVEKLSLYGFLSEDDKKLSEEEMDILQAISKNIEETNYLNHFRAADQNHDGYVTAAELKSRFQALGTRYTLQQMTNFINRKDQDGDQRFNYKGKNSPFEFKTDTCSESGNLELFLQGLQKIIFKKM